MDPATLASLITLGATIINAVVTSVMKASGMTREEAIALLDKDMAAMPSDQAAAEAKDTEIIEGKKPLVATLISNIPPVK